MNARTTFQAAPVFPDETRAHFAACYPEVPHKLHHRLDRHPLLEIEALACLAEALPGRSIEYNRGDLPIGIDGKPGPTGLTIGETIRGIETSGSWAVLKNVEQSPAYARLLSDLLAEQLNVGGDADLAIADRFDDGVSFARWIDALYSNRDAWLAQRDRQDGAIGRVWSPVRLRAQVAEAIDRAD